MRLDSRAIPAIALAAACCKPGGEDDSGTSTSGALFSSDPVAVTDPTCPLVPTVTASASAPVSMTVTVGDRSVSTSSPSASPSLALYDFTPGITYSFSVTLTAGDRTETKTVAWTSAPLPAAWPQAENLVDPPDLAAMEPGYTFLPLTWIDVANYVAAIDQNGVPHWYYQPASRVDDLDLDLDGNPLYLDDQGLHRIDWACRPIADYVWDPPPDGAPAGAISIPGTQLFHHEVSQLSDGTFLTLDHEIRHVDDFPTDYDLASTAPADIDVPVVVRFDENGGLIDRISYFDLFQPDRIGWDSLKAGELDGVSPDWAHGNAAQWIASDDSYVISARQQDAVMKFHRPTADSLQIDWILANPANWSPPWSDALLTADAGTEWQYHQHAPVLSDDGTLVLFDNGNIRVSPPVPSPPSYKPESRAVEFHVDEAAMTVSTDWEHGDTADGPIDCTANGSVARLENGDVLMLCAYGANRGTSLNADLGHGLHTVRVIEFDPVTGVNRWDLELSSDAATNADGWSSARAKRIAAIGGP